MKVLSIALLALALASCAAPIAPNNRVQLVPLPVDQRIAVSEKEQMQAVNQCMLGSYEQAGLIDTEAYCQCLADSMETYFTKADWQAVLVANSEFPAGIPPDVLVSKLPKMVSLRSACLKDSVRK